MSEIEKEIIKRAIRIAAKGIIDSSNKDNKDKNDKGSTQINKIREMLYSEPENIDRLILYILRQSGKKNTIQQETAKILIEDIKYIVSQLEQKKIDLLFKYFTYISWSLDAIQGLTDDDKKNIQDIDSLSDILKMINNNQRENNNTQGNRNTSTKRRRNTHTRKKTKNKRRNKN